MADETNKTSEKNKLEKCIESVTKSSIIPPIPKQDQQQTIQKSTGDLSGIKQHENFSVKKDSIVPPITPAKSQENK
ncbi:hypothetical protein [Candidatus Formimonas warabiya]|uniref:Uncharacterized protein n=1 Tax=Formimonas warabiya TaxID=1761012 RepID=A0A3G1KNY2_FORW1|nr:hypothetical protein [Candidatus Formimonas warabiya]ATW24172.1 hypothetical protein DCMF_04680 [Candidatus Formimonas warabiya]